MTLTELKLFGYRNIGELDLFPCENVNIIYGDNAQGKTNLIEAIWLFTGNSSFRGAKSGELIGFNEEQARLTSRFCDKEREQEAVIQLYKNEKSSNRRKITLNSVPISSFAELNGSFFAVVFSPAHLSLIKDGPKGRRHFLDIAIAQIKPQYESYLSQYERLLEQRNALIKNAYHYRNLEENIEVWDSQLAKIGTVISIFRYDYVKKLAVLAGEIYDGLSDGRERLSISYQSTVFESPVFNYDDSSVLEHFNRLREGLPNDLKQGFTGMGVHRDDLEVLLDERQAKAYGSQGQQRSSVIALKLAEATLLKKVTGENPIMLLDDVMSELDIKRQDYILNHVKDLQVFITCCDVVNTKGLRKGRLFKLEGGRIIKQEEIGDNK